MADEIADASLLELATELTIAWLANPNTRASADEVPAFLSTMHAAVTKLTAPQPPAEASPSPAYIPAVSVRRSLASKDHLISLIDGKPYKTLKRHLSTHGLTPAEYRERYGLKADYPMVAENYAEMRRGMAKRIGLGNMGKTAGATSAAAEPATAASTAEPADRPAAQSPAEPAKNASAKPAAKSRAKLAAKAAKAGAKAAPRPAAKLADQSAPNSAAETAAMSRTDLANAPAKPKQGPSVKRAAKPKAAPRRKRAANAAP